MKFLATRAERLFISWVPHARRSTALAEVVDAESVFLYYFKKKGIARAALRYLLSTFKTWRLLLARRPEVIFCINQPIFLVLTCLAYSRLSGADLVLDHHAGAFNLRATAWARPLLRRAVRAATLNIAASREHVPVLEAWGGQVMHIGALPFAFSEVRPASVARPAIVYVCTFSADEPVREVIAAAKTLPEVHFFVTGSTSYADPQVLASAPPNLTFTGFLSDQAYLELLAGADAVLCLTTRDATLQRGAYEAMSLGQPVITSDWPVLRETFHRGAVFVDNHGTAIAQGVQQALGARPQLAMQMQALLETAQHRWAHDQATLRQRLGVPASPKAREKVTAASI